MYKLNLYEAIKRLKSMPYEEWITVYYNLLSNQEDSRIPLKDKKNIFYIIDYIRNAKEYEPELEKLLEKSKREYRACKSNAEIEKLAERLLSDMERRVYFKEDMRIIDKKRKKEFFIRILIDIFIAFFTVVILKLLFK